MSHLQRFGGAAAQVAAGTFVFGIVLALTRLQSYVAAADPASAVAALLQHEWLVLLWNVVITILFGIALVPVVLALRDRAAQRGADALARVAQAFGLIWATVIVAAGMVIGVGLPAVATLADTDRAAAESLWRVVDTVGAGLGGGIEVVGGVWVLLACVSAGLTRAVPRWIAGIGMLAGVLGVATVVPGIPELGAAFGVAMIVWFTLVGIVLWYLRPASAPVAAPVTAAV